MVLLAEAEFHPIGSADEFEDLLLTYLGDLAKNGQVWGEPLTTWIDDTVHVACHLPCPDSLSDQ